MNKIRKIIIRIVGKVSKLDTNMILFKSYNGDYSDSPRYIAEEIHRLCPEKKIVWSLSNLENPSVPDYAIKVAAGSKDEIISSYKASAIVSNVYGEKEQYLKSDNVVSKLLFKFKTFLNYKKGQHIYTTWHGTPFKKMGVDIEGSKIRDFSCPNTTMFVDNDRTKEIMQRLTFDKIKMIKLGSPRIDYLVNNNEKINDIKKRLGLPIDKKIILFAPTFREDSGDKKNIERSGINQLEMINVEKLCSFLKKRFGGDWAFVCRFHYHVSNLVDWSKLDKNVYNGNRSDDISDYLVCSDILLTDISSCLFEAILMNKLVFSLFPDLEYYGSIERGFYIPIKKLPFPCATSFQELMKNIQNYDKRKYSKTIKQFLLENGYISSNSATKTIAEYIIKDR